MTTPALSFLLVLSSVERDMGIFFLLLPVGLMGIRFDGGPARPRASGFSSLDDLGRFLRNIEGDIEGTGRQSMRAQAASNLDAVIQRGGFKLPAVSFDSCAE